MIYVLISIGAFVVVGFALLPSVRRLLSGVSENRRRFWAPILIGFGATVFFFGLTFLNLKNASDTVNLVAVFDVVAGIISMAIGFLLQPRFK